MPTPPRSVEEIDFTPRGPVFPSPVDWRDQFIYQLLVDRFDDASDQPPFDPAKTPAAAATANTPTTSRAENSRASPAGWIT